MALTKRPPKRDPVAIDAFINGAPDAAASAPAAIAAPAPAAVANVEVEQSRPAAKVAAKARKTPISLTIDEGILQRVDDRAASLGLSRAAAMALAASLWLESSAA